MKLHHYRFVSGLLCVIFLGAFSGSVFAQKASKPTVDEIVAKHLAAIGDAEARTAVRSIMAIGSAKAVFSGRGAGLAEGLAVIASSGNKNMVAMKFNNTDYRAEKFAFNGQEVVAGYVKPGVRSVLGEFLLINSSTFRYGITGGALSTSWTLRDPAYQQGKLKYGGMKKVGGRKVHLLEYTPKKSSDLSIDLFFDPETYHHVRTEYRRAIAAQLGGSVDSSARQSETRYALVENFADFRTEGKLTLPHAYSISLEILTGNGTASYLWETKLERFDFNKSIDDGDFNVDTY